MDSKCDFSLSRSKLFYIFIVVIFYILGEYLAQDEPKIKEPISLPEPSKQDFVQNSLYFIKERMSLNEEDITEIFNQNFTDHARTLLLKNSMEPKNLLAPGMDYKFHISNSFLEGYAPFITDSLWIPLHVIADKKTYALDEIQFGGYKEVWQTSSQAYMYTRGDCEDHAIALADWLIELGQDARVAVGEHNGEGHAWVVLFKDNKEYLLESTQKRNLKKVFPLAALETNYRPKMMFNRDDFWFNTGSDFTTSYSSNKWVKQSKYVRKKQF